MFDSALDAEQVFGHHGGMHRTYVRRRLLVALGLVLILLRWGMPAAARTIHGPDPAAPAVTTYVVRSGDTLWALARRLAPQEDPRLVVDRILSADQVDAGSLVPGQVIVLPAA